MGEPGERTGVLFVCLGNICRSPVAEAAFADLVARRGLTHRFDTDSAGTGGWHAGEPPDPRAARAAARFGLTLASRARRIDPASDWRRFHHIIAMDRSNREGLLVAGAPPGQVRLLREFDPLCKPGSSPDVPDPYHGGAEGFDRMLDMIMRSREGLLAHLAGRKALRCPPGFDTPQGDI